MSKTLFACIVTLLSCFQTNYFYANGNPLIAIGDSANSKIDTNCIISEIRREFKELNKRISRFSKVQMDVQDESVEGGSIVAYYDGQVLKKIETTFYGEMGNVVTEYYINNGNLFFVFKEEKQYDKPMYMVDSKIIKRIQNRYYFCRADLLVWIGGNKKKVTPLKSIYLEESKRIMDDFEKYISELRLRK